MHLSFYDDHSSSPNPQNSESIAYTWWHLAKNDPFLAGWGVTSKAGTKNSGQPGEVIIAWFKPLAVRFSFAQHSGDWRGPLPGALGTLAIA
jgi:hypothetical protein